MTNTDRDIREQVGVAVSANGAEAAEGIDIEAITREIVATYGLVSIDDIDAGAFWELVRKHDATQAAVVTEYVIAEIVAGEPRPLTTSQSFYSDRYYSDDQRGDLAVWSALDRVKAQTGGEYTVLVIREFVRGAGANRPLRSADFRRVERPLTDYQIWQWLTTRGAAHGVESLTARVAELRGSTADQLDAWYREYVRDAGENAPANA